MKQLSFLPKLKLDLRMDHGGDIRKGKRKKARPFSHKHAIHVVMRSVKAKGSWSLLSRRNEALVKRILEQCKRKYHIRVYNYVNVGNHLHLLIKAASPVSHVAQENFRGFLRQVAGAIAFQVTGARKGRGFDKNENRRSFWEKLAYSRIVSWGREYEGIKSYFIKNAFEARGGWMSRASLRMPWVESLLEAGIGPPRVLQRRVC